MYYSLDYQILHAHGYIFVAEEEKLNQSKFKYVPWKLKIKEEREKTRGKEWGEEKNT